MPGFNRAVFDQNTKAVVKECISDLYLTSSHDLSDEASGGPEFLGI